MISYKHFWQAISKKLLEDNILLGFQLNKL